MRCPYIKSTPAAVCRAAQSSYCPSEFELKEYCLSERHRMCPFYCKRHVAEDAESLLGKVQPRGRRKPQAQGKGAG